jgi:hypothetical protein
MDVTTGSGSFNLTQAEAFKATNDTEFTSSGAAGISSTSSVASLPTTLSASASAISPGQTSAAAASASKPSNVGAIAGGVVGGVAGLAIVVFALLLWLRHRRNQRRPPSAAYRTSTPAGPAPTSEKRYSPVPLAAPLASPLASPSMAKYYVSSMLLCKQ